MGAKRREATYEDLLRVPEHVVAEIVEGELYTSPRPAFRHARAMSRLLNWLSRGFDDEEGRGGWWIVPEPELHLGGDALVPDIGGWRRERVPVFPDVIAFEIGPDWVCEILSTSTAHLDRQRKMPRYAHHAVGHAWLLDPLQRTLEVFRLEEGRWSLIATHRGDAVVRAEPFDEVELPLARLWVAS